MTKQADHKLSERACLAGRQSTHWRRGVWSACRTALAGLCVIAAGCGGQGPVVVHGTVTHGQQPVEQGDVTFVPIEGTRGSGGGAQIVDSAYRVEGRGGLPLGKYRVIVNAFAKSGRKVKRSIGTEVTEADELRRVGPPDYASDASPLNLTIDGGSSEQFDINLPDAETQKH